MMKTNKENKDVVQVTKVRVGICKGYDRTTQNKGRFVISDRELEKMKEEGSNDS